MAGVPGKALPNSEAQDVLGEVFDAIHLKSEVPSPLRLTPPWGIRISKGPTWFYVITQGHCFIELEAQKSEVVLTSGDLAILTQGQHHLRDHPGRPVAPLEQVLTSSLVPSEENPGQNENLTTIVLGNFLLDHPSSGSLFSSLPALIHIKGEKGEPVPWLKDLLRVIAREAVSTQSGSRTIINQLVHVLFMQAVRSYVATMPRSRNNRLSALFDSGIGPVLRLLHHYPERNWTVAALAEKACMSRSAFAARFTALVGQPPLSYLFLCRMNKACHLLRDPLKGIKEIAPRVGYTSEAAFSNAFKRWAGTAPKSYRFTKQGH